MVMNNYLYTCDNIYCIYLFELTIVLSVVGTLSFEMFDATVSDL